MKKKLTAMVLALGLMLSMIPGAAALGNTVNIEEDTGTITVKPMYNGEVVTGQEVTLYKVGVARTENNNLFFDLADSLAGVEIDLNKGTITVDQVKELYAKISVMETTAKEELIAGKKTTIAEEGAKFEEMDVAVYLVAKTNSSRYNFDPFLLYLPFTSDDGAEWVFDVVAAPKTAYRRPSNPPVDPPVDPPVYPPEEPLEDPEVPLSPGNPGDSGEEFEELEDPEVPLGGLPQTGLLQWPIPLMAMAGILMFSAGFVTDRKARRSED